MIFTISILAATVPAALATAVLYLSCADLSNWSFVYGSVTERVRKNVLAFETVAVMRPLPGTQEPPSNLQPLLLH